MGETKGTGNFAEVIELGVFFNPQDNNRPDVFQSSHMYLYGFIGCV